MSGHPGIVCAVDLSRGTKAAFSQAVALAKSHRARLDAVFAVPAHKTFNWRARKVVARLAAMRYKAAAADVDMTISIHHGTPADVILAHAEARNTAPADLIVLGAPRRRGIERLRWPSIAKAVVRQADCPTLVVPDSTSADPNSRVPFRRVLCAIDFSPASTAALNETLRILRHGGGTTRLLHVVDIARPVVPRGALAFSAIDYTSELTRYAWRQLRLLLPLSDEFHGRVQPHVSVGLVIDEIARTVNEWKADLVVLGATKRGWLTSLLSSTIRLALRRLDCPVLAVPAGRLRNGAGVRPAEATPVAA